MAFVLLFVFCFYSSPPPLPSGKFFLFSLLGKCDMGVLSNCTSSLPELSKLKRIFYLVNTTVILNNRIWGFIKIEIMHLNGPIVILLQ